MTPLVQVDSVSLSFWRGDRETVVLRDVSLQLDAGEFGGIWGRRSVGKTTLAHVIAGLQVPDEGRVLFDGRELRDPDRDGQLIAQIGLASRHGPELEDMDPVTWISSTLVHVSSWRDARRRARDALNRVGIGEVGQLRWSHLSEGERMLASIAQAIVRGPRLLVVDDPVAGFAGADRAEVMDLLREIAAEGVAVLMTASEVAELGGVDQIWALDRGHLDGPPPRPLGAVVPLRAADRP
jgi:ABC-type multidrug transport system ATPase subunit